MPSLLIPQTIERRLAGAEMAGFIEEADRGQLSLLPGSLDDWVDKDNPVRVIDAFVDGLDLKKLGHKTIADFRKDNGGAIKKVCGQFIELCRSLGLLSKASVAIDGSKFKAVNNRDKNFTQGKVEKRRTQLEESVARYLAQLDTADLQEPSESIELKKTHLKEKLEKLKSEMQKLEAIERQVLASPDKQISLTDPDCRSMATSGRGSGVVGYNVQIAVDTEHHLIVHHEVTNVGSDRSQLASTAAAAKEVLGVEKLEAVADRGYFNGEEIKACDDAGFCRIPRSVSHTR